MVKFLIVLIRYWLLRLGGNGDLLNQLAIQKSLIHALQEKAGIKSSVYELELKQRKNGTFGARMYYFIPDDRANRIFMEEYSELVLKETQHYLQILNKRIRIFLQNSANSADRKEK